MHEVAGKLAGVLDVQKCINCRSPTSNYVWIHAGNIALSCEIPIPVCRGCLRKYPFTLKPTDTRWWVASSLLIFALITAAANFHGFAILLLASIALLPLLMQGPPTTSLDRRNEDLQRLLAKVELLRCIGSQIPGFKMLLPPQFDSCISDQWDHLERFQDHLREYSRITLLVTEADLQRSQIDPRLMNALLLAVKTHQAEYISRLPDQEALAFQVDCAVLPGRRMVFELQSTLPDSHPIRLELLNELCNLPPIGVRWPVLFSVKFTNTSGHSLLNDKSAPFPSWTRESQVPDTTAESQSPGSTDCRPTWAEAALKLFSITPDPQQPLLTIDDCFAWQAIFPVAIFPLANGLLDDLTHLLVAEHRHREAIAVLEPQLTTINPDRHLLHKFAWLLSKTNQPERAAAACQHLMRCFPDYSDGWGMLAALQLQMQRPHDAELTLLAAPRAGRSPDFWITSADVAAALGNFSQAIAYLNVAILKNLGCVPALLQQAELFRIIQMPRRALQNVEVAERLQHASPDLILFKAQLLVELKQIQSAIVVVSHGIDVLPADPRLLVLRAELLMTSAKPSLALEDCHAALRVHPDFVDAYELEALIHIENDDPDAAITAAERAMHSEKVTYRSWYARGLAKLTLQQYEDAAGDLQAACLLSPDDPQVRYALAKATLACGDDDAAFANLNSILSKHPTNCDALCFRGFLQIARGDSELAAADFQKAIDSAPHALWPIYGLSVAKREAGDYAEALSLLDTALKIDPSHEASLFDRARLLATRDDLQAASHDLNAILESDPTSLPALLSRARLNLHLGNLDEARRDFNAVLKQDPESTEALIGRSVLAERSGELFFAEQDLQKANEINPEDTDGIEIARLLMQATIAHQNERFEDAVAACSQALEIHPEHVIARRERARAFWYSDSFVEALEDYQYLLDNSDHPRAELLLCRGGIYNELGEFDLALEDLEKSRQLAIMERPEILPWALSSLARTLTALERWNEAESAFTECLRLGHNSPWFHYYHGLYFLARNDRDSAIRSFERALHITTRRLPPGKRTRARALIRKLQAGST